MTTLIDRYAISTDHGQTWHALDFKSLGNSLYMAGMDVANALDTLWEGYEIKTPVATYRCNIESLEGTNHAQH